MRISRGVSAIRLPIAAAAGLLGLLASVGGCGGEEPPTPPKAPPAKAVGPAGPVEQGLRLRGGPAAGDVFRSRGTLSFHTDVAGRFGAEHPLPSRRVEGAVEAERKVTARAEGGLSSTVTGRLVLKVRVADAAPTDREVPFTLTYDEGPDGGAVHRSIQLQVDKELAPALETLQGAFTDRFAPPARPLRVGDGFPPQDVLFLDDLLRRPLFFLFQRQASEGKAVGAPFVGRAWVEAREAYEGEDVIRLRVSLTHAYEGETDPGVPSTKNVRITWWAAVEAVRRIAVDGGWARTHDFDVRRRLRYVGSDLDYTVETEGHTIFDTTRAPR